METEDKESDYDRGQEGGDADMEDGELPEDGEIVDEEERQSCRKESRHREHRDRDNGFEEGEGTESDKELSKRARKRRRHCKNRPEGSADDSKKSKKKKKKEHKKYIDHDHVEEEDEDTPDWNREQTSHGHHHHHHDNNKHHHEHPREHRKFEEEEFADSPAGYGSPFDKQDRTPEYEYDDYDDFEEMEPPHKKTMMSFVDDGFIDPSMGMGDRQELFEHHHRGRGRGPGRGGQMMRGGRGRGRGRGDRGRGRGGQDRGRGGQDWGRGGQDRGRRGPDRGRGGQDRGRGGPDRGRGGPDRGRGGPDRGRGGQDRGRGGRGRGGMQPHGPPHQHDHGNQRGPPPRREEMKQNRPICKYFKDGFCHKGDGCVFSHDCVPNHVPNHKMEVCKFYISGQCRKGDNCSYLHGQYPCKYFHTNAKCFQGNNCKFSHEPLDDKGQLLLEKILREQSEREMERESHRDRQHHHEDRGMMMNEMDENRQFGGSPPHMYEGDANDGIPSLLDIKTNPPSPEKHGPSGSHGPHGPHGHGPPGPRGPRPHGPPPMGMLRPQGFYKDTLASPTRHPGPHGPSLRPPLLADPIPHGMPLPHMQMPCPSQPSAANVVSAMAEAIATAIRTHQKETLKAKEEKQDEPKVAETVPKPSDLIKTEKKESVPDFAEALPNPAESESQPKPADLSDLPKAEELLKTESSEPTVSEPMPVINEEKDDDPEQSTPAVEVKMEPIEIMSPTGSSTVPDNTSTENANDQSSADQNSDQKPAEVEVEQEPMETNDGEVEKLEVEVKTESMETSEVKVKEEPKDEADEKVPVSPSQNSEAKPVEEQAVETKPQTNFPEIPENLPLVQRQLLLRLQQAQKEPEPPQENTVTEEEEIEDDNWYSSDEEEELPTKKSLSDIMKNLAQTEPPKAASPPLVKPPTSAASVVPAQPVMDIGSMLSMIRQQTVAAGNVSVPVVAPPASVAVAAPVVTSTANAPPVRRDPRLQGAPAPRIDPRTQQPPPTSSAPLVAPPVHVSASPRHNEPTPEIYGIISNPKPFRLVHFTLEPNNRPCLPPGLNITDPRYREDPRCSHYKNTVVKRSNSYQPSLPHGGGSPGQLRPPANLHRRDSSSSDSGMDMRLKTQTSAPGALGPRDPRMLNQARSMDPRSSGGSSPAAHRTGGDPRAPPVLSQARPMDPRAGGGSSPAAHRTGGDPRVPPLDPRAAPMPKLLTKDPRSDLQNPNLLGFELPPLGSSSNHQFAMPKLLLERPEPLKGKPELQNTPQSPLPMPALALPPLLAQPPPLLTQPPPAKMINLETGSPQNSPPAMVQKLSPAHHESSEIASPPSSDRTKSLAHRADPRFKRRPSVKNPEPEPAPVVIEDKTEQRRQNVEYSSPLSGQSNRQEDSYSSYNRRPNNYEKSGRKGGKSDPRQSNGGQDPRQRRDPRFPGGSGDPRGHSDPRKQSDNDQQVGDPRQQQGEPSFLHPAGGDPRFQQASGDPRFQQTGGFDSQMLPGCNPTIDSFHGAGGMNIDLTDPRFQQITGLPPEVFAQMQQQQSEQSLRDVFKTFDPTASPFC